MLAKIDAITKTSIDIRFSLRCNAWDDHLLQEPFLVQTLETRKKTYAVNREIDFFNGKTYVHGVERAPSESRLLDALRDNGLKSAFGASETTVHRSQEQLTIAQLLLAEVDAFRLRLHSYDEKYVQIRCLYAGAEPLTQALSFVDLESNETLISSEHRSFSPESFVHWANDGFDLWRFEKATLRNLEDRLLTARVGTLPYYQDSLDRNFLDSLQVALRGSTL